MNLFIGVGRGDAIVVNGDKELSIDNLKQDYKIAFDSFSTY